MILEMSTDKLTISSGDPMDVEFLDSLFRGSVQIKKTPGYVYRGFQRTDEKSVCVTITKENDTE